MNIRHLIFMRYTVSVKQSLISIHGLSYMDTSRPACWEWSLNGHHNIVMNYSLCGIGRLIDSRFISSRHLSRVL